MHQSLVEVQPLSSRANQGVLCKFSRCWLPVAPPRNIAVERKPVSQKMWHSRVWTGMAGCGLAWQGVGWHGRVWAGMAGCGPAWQGVARHGRVWAGMVGCGLAWQGVAQHGRVWWAWQGVGWHGRVWWAWQDVRWHGRMWAGTAGCGLARQGGAATESTCWINKSVWNGTNDPLFRIIIPIRIKTAQPQFPMNTTRAAARTYTTISDFHSNTNHAIIIPD